MSNQNIKIDTAGGHINMIGSAIGSGNTISDNTITVPHSSDIVTAQEGIATAEQRSREQLNVALRQILTTYFSDSELRDLCFDLHIDYEILAGQGKGDKARELVAYVGRIGRTTELVALCRRLRPRADWQNVDQLIPPEL